MAQYHGSNKIIESTRLTLLRQNQGQLQWIISKPCFDLLISHNCSYTSISVPSNLLERFPPFSNHFDPFFPLYTLNFPIFRKWPKTLNTHPIRSENLPMHLFDLVKSFNACNNPYQFHHYPFHTLGQLNQCFVEKTLPLTQY